MNADIVELHNYSVERLVDPPLYYAKELDEAIQVIVELKAKNFREWAPMMK